jgi:hypothetical protein
MQKINILDQIIISLLSAKGNGNRTHSQTPLSQSRLWSLSPLPFPSFPTSAFPPLATKTNLSLGTGKFSLHKFLFSISMAMAKGMGLRSPELGILGKRVNDFLQPISCRMINIFSISHQDRITCNLFTVDGDRE